MLAEYAALCIKGMKNVIIDSHQEMFYGTAEVEISSHESISNGALLRNLFFSMFSEQLFFRASFVFICIGRRTVRWKKVRNSWTLNHVFLKYSINQLSKKIFYSFLKSCHSSVSLSVSGSIEMCYSGLKNKTSRVKNLSRKIVNTFLIREEGRTFESQKSAEKLVNIH